MTLHRLLRETAARTPDRIAVADPSGRFTYRDLDRAADRIAHRLRAAGVGRGDRVVVWSGKSAAAVAAMQAVLRTGAAYVPADGTSPARRVATIAADCAARAVCTTTDRLAEAAAMGARVARVDLGMDIAGRPDAEPGADGASRTAETVVEPDDLAYILYTSGSTGTPKGVCVSHGGARAFVDWAVRTIRAEPGDRFANHAPFTFDLSVLDLYAPFAVGASVHLIASELAHAPGLLVDFLYREGITVWYSVPSALSLMMREGGLLDRPAPESLRAVLFAGEVFPISGVRALAGWTSARLLNLYGPTETNVCTSHEVTPADLARERPVPIGFASCGDIVWARRADGHTAGPGEEGELIVAGPTVMRGYWGSPPQDGPYGTGDIVRVLPDGSFDYVGRRDQMVKVRGHRIEPGDVESALAAHPAVAEAAAIATGSGVDSRLVAFVVPRPGESPGVLDLKRHSAQRLPRHMIPDETHIVPELPRTANGKVDRARLRARPPVGRTR
ncbi:amino acid adenylation domain-containing protein [Actinomadura sp. 9N215]|uniref:amino acid adenylation domain-containing protein n=1 Tax=Actinomadura sp. 9N215 TaxID=3375150 RepID=UPI0037A5B9E8